MLRYAWRDLTGNPRRSFASLAGVALGIGLFSGVLFFMDASGATLTARALAPLPLDLQWVLTTPPGGGLRLNETVSPRAGLAPRQEVTVRLVVTQGGGAPANEVVVNDVPPPPLSYESGSTAIDGRPIPDVDGESPLSHGPAGLGLNIGRVRPGAPVTISYIARAEQAVDDPATLQPGASVSSREELVPIEANAAPVLTLAELRDRVSSIRGVAAADTLGFVDLPPGSLASGDAAVPRPVRILAFEDRYRAHYPSIRIVAGGFRPGSALVSVEAGRALTAAPGSTVELRLPGRGDPLSLPVSGVVDLARADPLFSSRKSTKLEEFLYVPDTVVVTPATFRDVIVPAFDRARSSLGHVMKSFPVQELDVLVDRSRLETDPATALAQTNGIAGEIDRLGSGQGYLIDDISNALAVAKDDAAASERMFLFLGIPGLLMAILLAAYAVGILATSERRERANLRVRGAHRGHLRRIALYKAMALAAAGAIFGIVLGFVSVVVILGWRAVSEAALRDLALSGIIAVTVGAVITALALYLPARRSLGREVGQERRQLHVSRAPAWRRFHLDIVMLGLAGVAWVVALRTGAFDPPAGSVYSGIAVSIPSRLFVAPLMLWVGGVLFCVRVVLAAASGSLPQSGTAFGPVVPGVLRRSVRRRPWALATGIAGLGLVVAFGAAVLTFSASYDAAKAADARFFVGSDLRITPSVRSAGIARAGDASRFAVAGVAAVTPVVFDLENAVLIGPYDQGRANLAAIDPSGYSHVAPLPDAFFAERTGAAALAALRSDPAGILVDTETADDLSVEPGDVVEVILARGTVRETKRRFHVLGVFERLAGFPQGANLVVDLGTYEATTGVRAIDFFLARADDSDRAGLAEAASALRAGPGASSPIHIDSTATALDKDQSSLTALNIAGLVRLDTFFVLLMSVAAIAIFVFGLMLQRRREYVTLRAMGLPVRDLRALVLGEAALVALCGLASGILVGVAIASLFVRVLRGLFILDPPVTSPVGRIALLAASVLAAALVSGVAATRVLRRLRPTEILREE